MQNNSGVCRSCGDKIPKNFQKFVAVSLLGLGVLCWSCHLAASATGKQIDMPTPKSMANFSNFILMGTATTAAGPTGPVASGDAKGMTFFHQGGDIPILSEIPAHERKADGVAWPIRPYSVFQNEVNKNGSEISPAN